MEPFQHALVGFGRGDADRSVLAQGALVGAALGIERYTLAHVLRTADLPDGASAPHDPQQQREQLLAEMDEAKLATAGWPAQVQFEHVLLAGMAGDQLVRLAAQEKVDLVVIGRQRHKTQTTLGLAAGRLVHQSPASVLVAAREARPALKKILVPVDFSSPAGDALSVARQIAAATGAEVVAQHVYRVPPGFEKRGDEFKDLAATLRAHAERQWSEFSAAIATPPPLPEVRYDLIPQEDWQTKPADVVVQRADELEADLIVCGSQGHSGLTRLFLGSTSEGILKRTQRAVLCVKRKQENLGLLQALFGE
ncbi:MAG: universal stress protein [Pirellulales bacterium]|nr:universal stress protein [Pirellulales bacterium]